MGLLFYNRLMKLVGFLALILMLSTQAQAGFNGRKPLDVDTLDDIKQMERFDKFRVYLNKKITMYFSSEAKKKNTELEVTSEVKGKIIDEDVKILDEYKKD